jgi:mobilization protein NikA
MTLWEAAMRRKNDVWLDDAELEQIKEVAEKRGLSVSAYMRRVGVREARDDLLEQAANRRLAADRRQRYEEAFNEPFPEPAAEPMPTLAPTPDPVREKDPGRAMTWEEYEVEYAEVMQAYKARLDRLSHCPHKDVTPGSVCPKCNRLVRPRGSRGNAVTEPRFRFHIPTRNGLGQ